MNPDHPDRHSGGYTFGQGSRITMPSRLDVQAAWTAVTSWPDHARAVPLTQLRVAHPPGKDTPGVGDTLRAVTGVGPLRIVDTMVVTTWQPPVLGQPGIAVLVKTGAVVVGGASVQVDAAPDADGSAGSVITWWEDARPGNVLAQRLTRPVTATVTKLVFGRALRHLLTEAEEARR